MLICYVMYDSLILNFFFKAFNNKFDLSVLNSFFKFNSKFNNIKDPFYLLHFLSQCVLKTFELFPNEWKFYFKINCGLNLYKNGSNFLNLLLLF